MLHTPVTSDSIRTSMHLLLTSTAVLPVTMMQRCSQHNLLPASHDYVLPQASGSLPGSRQ